MDEMIQRLSTLLREKFSGSAPELHQIGSAQKVGGFLIWEGFDGIEQLDRQRQVGTAIRAHLQPHEVLQVSTILTATPDEAELMQAD